MRPALSIIFLVFCSLSRASDQIPAPPQTHPILIKDATIHPLSSGNISHGQILFVDGVITAIGKRIYDLPDDVEIINLKGKHIYPGLIAAGTTVGLVEINAVRATRDFTEVGKINPNVRAEVGYNPDSDLIPVTRSNGITVVHTVPQGGLISGMSAAMMLDGWTWEDATLKAPIGLHLNWPRMTINRATWITKSEEEQKEDREKQLRELDEVFEKARGYLLAKKASGRTGIPHHDTDLRWESMIPILENEIPVFIHANEIQQIEMAVDWTYRQKIKMVLVGGKDAWRVSDLLKKNSIPVILENIHSLPARRFEDYDAPFTTAVKLYKAGVKFCISASSSSFEAPHQRNLPYQAATASAYGLPKIEALKSITLYAAEILGIDDQVGSLDIGKDATFIVTDGDPLEITTNVEMEFIQGKRIDLGNRHKTLYEKYQAKYRQLGIIR